MNVSESLSIPEQEEDLRYSERFHEVMEEIAEHDDLELEEELIREQASDEDDRGYWPEAGYPI